MTSWLLFNSKFKNPSKQYQPKKDFTHFFLPLYRINFFGQCLNKMTKNVKHNSFEDRNLKLPELYRTVVNWAKEKKKNPDCAHCS